MKYIKKYIEYLKESSKRDFMEKIRKTLGDIKDVKMLNYKWGYEYKNGVDLEKITPKEEWNKILLLGEEFVDREKYKENDNKPFRILAIGKINLDLYLTIDSKIQIVAQDALKDYRGAAVAIDPNNGEVLALASSPVFDPNIFVRGIIAMYYADFCALINYLIGLGN